MSEIVRLGEVDSDRVLSLYHRSFDKACRDPDSELIEDLRGSSQARATYWVDGIVDGEWLVGMVRWRYLASIQATFIVHLAVDAAFRKRGFGDLLLAFPRDQYPAAPTLLEVEHVNSNDPLEKQEECRRRLAWFAKHGTRLLTATYTQPALHTDTEAVPLNLLAIGYEVMGDVETTIEGFYRDVWELPLDHPFVGKAIADAVL